MRKTPIVLASAALLLTACSTKQKPSSENFLAALNAYLADHPDCLLDSSIRFPYETGDPLQIRQLDALVGAQILTAAREPIIHVTRYTMTDTGQRVGAHLCYGHRLATAIVSSTPPTQVDGFTETQVVYRYEMQEAPIWAKGTAVQAVYPKLAEALSGNATAKKALALTGVGWKVPD
ncbi:hypothetical protein FTO74_12015 [Granulicella sp. WH15]|uniref:lipoprotein n=1 Tax=Granulicella sp. WH15 TaxID=2602070 RepID=UPI001366F112|nr:lipoprotein [Granulicella sp. WH15]QHN04016.1 hypothetical protein FTO74_12015 [Granulicella sp. WH15]